MIVLSRHKLDFIIGLFVLCAAISVVFIALKTANITAVSGSNGYHVQVEFDNIGSLVERAPVKSSGVLVGRVQKISYNSDDYIATVDIILENQYQFPADSIFSIVSSNLLGGQYIAIDVGGEEEFIENNQVFQGNSAIVLEELISKFLFDNAGE
ncbi:MAG: outer membrane lipid asymmetry maintenance protein MlaD [Proteobacteria bacterium]|nr:outer membrane lipid asymmetry maintenance protein MlaD [Pseudomonadota bacterium]